ncbi:hypothetical protein BDZ45DRAFT_345986 [Acephala macrosclerotiorum]|nr:hypothetical protein BDZ45DRAFT_345986 [Acephala macrosclerotiorum]
MASIQRIALHESAPESGLDPQGSSDPSSWRDMPLTAMGTGIGRQVSFQIVRGISLANKIGGAIGDEQGPNFDAIDGFNTAVGDFLLDSLLRPNELATVTNIAGIQGNVQLRKLQDLKRPWGWSSERVALLGSPAQAGDIVSSVNAQPPRIGDVDIPVEFYRIILSDKSTHGAMTVNVGKSKKQALRPLLEALGGGKGPKGQTTKGDIIREIQEIIAKSADVKPRTRAVGGLTLPLYTLNIAFPATRTQRAPFLAGEVIRLWNNTPDRDDNVRILDYEGHDASIPLDQLTAVDTAFGLVLDEGHAPNEFRTNGEPLVALVSQISTNQRQSGDSLAGRLASSNYRADPEILAQLATLDPNEAEDLIRTTAREAGRMTANVNVALRAGAATLKRGPEAVRRSPRVKRQKAKSE